jgi:hypothetical protein
LAAPLKLISHKLCPYVQRALIALTETGVRFERIGGLKFVTPGLVPGIHVLPPLGKKGVDGRDEARP